MLIRKCVGFAYSLGFFLGPGRPRDFAVGSVCSFVLLFPGLGPGTPFRRCASLAVAPVAGVELASASEPLSAEDGRTVGSSADEAGEELSLDLVLGVLFWLLLGLANCWRASPDSLRTTIKELGEFLAPRERPFGVAAGMMDGCWKRDLRGTGYGRGIIDGRQFTVTWYVSLPPVIDEEVCVVA